MDVILPQSRATEVEFYPPESRPLSATVRFLSPAGVVISTPAATLDTCVRTVVAAVDAETYTVSGGAGPAVPGRFYWWASDAETISSLVMLSDISGSTWYLEQPPATLLGEAEDVFYGARFTVTILAASTATLGENYRIEWTVTDISNVVRIYDQVAHVTRKNFRAAVSPMQARDYFATAWPSIAADRRYGFFVRMATRASERVWRRIRKAGRYLHLLIDSDDFDAAGRVALERECATDNLIPAGTIDTQSYRESLDAQLNQEIDDVISSRPYDENNDNAVDSTEVRTSNAISLRRW